MYCLIGILLASISRPLALLTLAFLIIDLSINPPRIYAVSKSKIKYLSQLFREVLLHQDSNILISFLTSFQLKLCLQCELSWANIDIPFFKVEFVLVLQKNKDEYLEGCQCV